MKNKLSIAMSLALIMAMLVTSLALADNLQGDDLNAGGNATKYPGQTGTAAFWLVANGNDGCNADSNYPVNVSVSSNKSWLTVDTSVSITACGQANTVTVGYTVASNAPIGEVAVIQGIASGGIPNNNGFNNNPGDFTVTIIAPADSTPPVVTPNVAGTLGNNGWYVSDVTVSWAVSDPDSAITSTTGCGSTTFNTDTAGTTLTCTATSLGGTSSASVTIKRDATAPTINASVSPDRPESDWWNIASGAPTVTYDCSDDTSGIASCTDPFVFPEGENQSHTGTAVDNAGNSATASVSNIDVDLTAPTIILNVGPADGGEYYFGFVPPLPSEQDILVSDNLSGPNLVGVNGYGLEVGTHTMTVTAYDNAGNFSSISRTYTVLAWKLSGFYQPVDMNGVWNTVKSGSTVPFKFEVFAGSLELTDTSVVFSFVAAPVACPITNVTADAIEFTTTGGTSLRYDWTAGQFINNWQTPKKPGACYVVTMTTQDGSNLSANFKLK